jgi:hypothetical protein
MTDQGRERDDDRLGSALDRIPASFDRFQEAHFWIHGMETYYHLSAHFRWHFSAFLKALKEIPQLLQMELQNEPGFIAWFRDRRDLRARDPLIAYLSKQRDIVVHRDMLVPNSRCSVGITELRSMKLGMGVSSNPLEDSEHAMHPFLYMVAERGDVFSILTPDEDSVPCVHRIWRLTGFDEEVIELCARGWLRTGETLAEVIRWLGAEPPPLSLDCRHGEQNVQFKLFDREKLNRQLPELKNERI